MFDGKLKRGMMAARHQTDDDQTALWNGPAGRAWLDAQDALDQMLKPLESLLVEDSSAGSPSPRQVLDVGCGTGGTTVAIARTLGRSGRSTGIDISAPMIGAASVRLTPAMRSAFRTAARQDTEGMERAYL